MGGGQWGVRVLLCKKGQQNWLMDGRERGQGVLKAFCLGSWKDGVATDRDEEDGGGWESRFQCGEEEEEELGCARELSGDLRGRRAEGREADWGRDPNAGVVPGAPQTPRPARLTGRYRQETSARSPLRVGPFAELHPPGRVLHKEQCAPVTSGAATAVASLLPSHGLTSDPVTAEWARRSVNLASPQSAVAWRFPYPHDGEANLPLELMGITAGCLRPHAQRWGEDGWNRPCHLNQRSPRGTGHPEGRSDKRHNVTAAKSSQQSERARSQARRECARLRRNPPGSQPRQRRPASSGPDMGG